MFCSPIATALLFITLYIISFYFLVKDVKTADDITDGDDLFDFEQNEEEEVRFNQTFAFVQFNSKY